MRGPLDGPLVEESASDAMPDPLDFEDAGLTAMGFMGEVKTYRARLERIRALADEGKGPGGFLAQFLAACGYKGAVIVALLGGCREPLPEQGGRTIVWQDGATVIYRVTTTDGLTCYVRSTGYRGGLWCREGTP